MSETQTRIKLYYRNLYNIQFIQLFNECIQHTMYAAIKLHEIFNGRIENIICELTIRNTFNLSRGAVDVLETAPASPPATR